MSDEAEFLKTLRENPNDDTTRLVYADWLDERDDPRAEFIRLRQQFARITARINELSEQFDPGWLATVGVPKLGLADLTLRSGRRISLRSLGQSLVYEGLLEGLPTQEMNQRTIESLVNTQRTQRGQEPFLIAPRERPIKYRDDRPYPFGTPAAIPGVTCVGRFQSFQPARDEAAHASELVVIWFQNEFAFPIDPVVLEQILAIDWEQHAVDFEW